MAAAVYEAVSRLTSGSLAFALGCAVAGEGFVELAAAACGQPSPRSVTVAGPFAPPLPALAVPQEGGGLPALGARGLFDTGADLGESPRMLPFEGAAPHHPSV